MIETIADISRKILFVDDEVLLLDGIKRQLRREFDIDVAEGGEAALAALQNRGPFAVVVSDYNMPGMNGIEFLNAVSRLDPHIVLIMLTGRAELDIAVDALHNAHIARFLNKPCPKEILQETLNDCLEQYRLRMSEKRLQAQLQQANQQLGLMNEQLEALVAQKTQALRLQYRYVAGMAQITGSQAVGDAFIDAVGELTGLTRLSLWLSPRQDGHFYSHRADQSELADFDQIKLNGGAIAASLSAKSVWTRVDGPRSFDAIDAAAFAGHPLICQPLLGKQGVIGLLNIAGDALPEAHILEALAGMADVTATTLQSHWHREAFVEAQDAIIDSLAKLSEYRDPETGAHLLRLKKYCALICRKLSETDQFRERVTAEFTDDLVRSSPLHDIGKVGIPDAILKKPGKLTAEEFAVMKNHAKIGGDTLRSVYEQYPSQSFIKCGMDVAYGHHEKWDGSGYPQGLSGTDIPLAARILALVDVYDALTCRRVYKAPFPREQAKAMIIQGGGSHFDPDIVEAFASIEDQFHRIAEQYADLI